MSNYSYVVSRSNVSILLTTLSNRTNPPFVANIKDESSTRRTLAITIVNYWLTSIAHTFGSGSSQRGSRRVVPQTTLPKKGRRLHRSLDDIWAIIHTFSRNLSNWANPPLVANIQDCNLRTLLSTRQLAHSSEQTDRSTCPTTKNFQKIHTNPHSRRAIS